MTGEYTTIDVEAGHALRPMRIATFWVSVLCAAARRVPWFVRAMRPVSVRAAWILVPELKAHTMANAIGLLGPEASRRVRARFGRRVVASFHDFIFELARLSHMSPEDARARIRCVEGRERYECARADGHGVIMVTAHLGSFEIALAALAEAEHRLHVVFQRDEMVPFERARTTFRTKLGVRECPIEGGILMWAGLSDALSDGATVLIQGDRVVKGQPGTPVRFCRGRILAPMGPVKLARLTGAPLVPAVSIRDPDGMLRVLIGEPIDPPATVAQDTEALQHVSDALSGLVLRYPDQWLTLHKVFLDDSSLSPPEYLEQSTT